MLQHRNNNIFVFKKRHQSLLEVLIAFALVALCVLPLIYPHVAMFKAQNTFIRKVDLDHVVNLLYAKILEKLYMNSIPWNDIEQTVFPVDAGLLGEIQYDKPLYFSGSYNFSEPWPVTDPKYPYPVFKPNTPGPYSLYLFKLTFNFLPQEFAKATDEVKQQNNIKYQYNVFVVRDQRPASSSQPGTNNPLSPTQSPVQTPTPTPPP